MPAFKHKTDKKIKVCKKYTCTLDGKHQEFLARFEHQDTVILPQLRLERRQLREALQATDPRPSLETRLELRDRLEELQRRIQRLKEQKEAYFLDNSPHIFRYFQIKQQLSTRTAEEPTTNKSQRLLQMFKMAPAPPPAPDGPEADASAQSVYHYLRNIDEEFPNVWPGMPLEDIGMTEPGSRDPFRCSHCITGELVSLEDEGMLVCNHCAVSVPCFIEHEKPSFKDPPKEVCFYAYKRINHFKEILSQFQGKETTNIPPHVIAQIRHQIQKERLALTDLTYDRVKDILRTLGFNKLYEHIPYIKNKLGIKPPEFSSELEDVLCNLFMEIQAPYARCYPDVRVNFLHYYYVLYKFCELLNQRQYLKDIPMLKERDKLIKQDEIWKKMCALLDWDCHSAV
jgi:hypothetical protein